MDNGGIDNCTAVHQQACIIESVFEICKYLFSYLMFLKKMTEFEQCCCIRNLLIIKVYPHECSHGVTVVYCVLYSNIGQIKPYLQQIHTQHCFDTSYWATSFA